MVVTVYCVESFDTFSGMAMTRLSTSQTFGRVIFFTATSPLPRGSYVTLPRATQKIAN